jgi:hypothetical protein
VRSTAGAATSCPGYYRWAKSAERWSWHPSGPAWHLPILIGRVNYPGQNLWLAWAVFMFVTVGLAFPCLWFFRISDGSVVVTSILHTSLNSYRDNVLPTLLPSGNPLLLGIAMGIVLTALVLAVYVVRASVDARRRTTPATGGVMRNSPLPQEHARPSALAAQGATPALPVRGRTGTRLTTSS